MIYRWGKDQREARHCLFALQTWGAGTDACAGVPSPCHAIHGVAVVNRAIGYQIWRRGRTAPSHRHSSGYIMVRRGISAPLVYTLKIRCLVLIW